MLAIFILVLLILTQHQTIQAQRPEQDASLRLATDRLVMKQGDTFDIHVLINADRPTLGAQCELHFDPNLVEVISFEEGDFYKTWAEANQKFTYVVSANASPENEKGIFPAIGITVVGNTAREGVTGTGTLLTFQVKAKSDVEGLSQFRLEKIVVADAGQTGNIAALEDVYKQDLAIRIGKGAAPTQPALVRVPPFPYTDSQVSEPTPPPLKSSQPLSPEAQAAVAYLSQRESIPEDNLVIGDEVMREFPLQGRVFRAIKLFDARPTGEAGPDPIYVVYVDLQTGEVVDDISAVEKAEDEARLNKYGKLDPSLYDKIQTMLDADEVTVMVWTLPGPGHRLGELEAQAIQALAAKYPEVELAVDRNKKFTDLGDKELTRIVEQEYFAMINTGMAQRVQGAVEASRNEGLEAHEFPGAPFFSVRLTKEELLRLAQREGVGMIYLAEGEIELLMDSAANTDRAPIVWDQGLDGSGVIVAVHEGDLVDSDSPPGSQCPAGNNCFLNPVLLRGDPPVPDIDNHATQVASIIASDHSVYRGIAPRTTILSAGFLNVDPGYDMTDRYATDALIWAFNNQADIVNASWGRYLEDTPGTNLARIFDYFARTQYRLIVAAAGNEPDLRVAAPARGWNVLAVGAYDDRGDTNWIYDEMAFFSTYQNPEGDYEKPEVVAPGRNITSIQMDGMPVEDPDDVGLDDGTSFAAPQVAGEAALLIQRNNELRIWPEALRSIIMASAVHNIEGPSDIPTGMDLKDGAGGIDIALASTMTRLCATDEHAETPCWWGDTVSNDHINHYFTATRGERVRVAISWWSNSDCESVDDCSYDRLDTNLDLLVKDEFGNTIDSRVSINNSYELVDFIAPATGTYRIWIYLQSKNEPYNYVGVAWVKDSTYLDNLVNAGGIYSRFSIRNIGSVARDFTINYFDTNGDPTPEVWNACWLNPGQECYIDVNQYDRIPSGGSVFVDGGEEAFVRSEHIGTGNEIRVASPSNVFAIPQAAAWQFPVASPNYPILGIAMPSDDQSLQAVLNEWADVAISSVPCSSRHEVVPGTDVPSPLYCGQLSREWIFISQGKHYYIYYVSSPKTNTYMNHMVGFRGQSIVNNLGFTPIGVVAPNWDVNLDFVCNTVDLSSIGTVFMWSAPFSGNLGNPNDPYISYWARADVVVDGIANILDLSTTANHWLETWSP